jgi:hypothetical protein
MDLASMTIFHSQLRSKSCQLPDDRNGLLVFLRKRLFALFGEAWQWRRRTSGMTGTIKGGVYSSNTFATGELFRHLPDHGAQHDQDYRGALRPNQERPGPRRHRKGVGKSINDGNRPERTDGGVRPVPVALSLREQEA